MSPTARQSIATSRGAASPPMRSTMQRAAFRTFLSNLSHSPPPIRAILRFLRTAARCSPRRPAGAPITSSLSDPTGPSFPIRTLSNRRVPGHIPFSAPLVPTPLFSRRRVLPRTPQTLVPIVSTRSHSKTPSPLSEVASPSYPDVVQLTCCYTLRESFSWSPIAFVPQSAWFPSMPRRAICEAPSNTIRSAPISLAQLH